MFSFGGASVWKPRAPTPARPRGPPVAATWWDQYSNQLNLPPQVIREINSATTQISGQINPNLHNPNGRLSVVGAHNLGRRHR